LTGGAFAALLVGAFWWNRRNANLPHHR
jgi:hypothetical protein